MFKKICIIGIMFFTGIIVYGQENDLIVPYSPENVPFNTREVIEQIRHYQDRQSDKAPKELCSQDGEFLIDTNLVYFPAICDQQQPSIAFDGTNYLVVWMDDRKDSDGSKYYDIYGARVSQEGVILDPAGIAISTAEQLQGYPLITSDGTNYLVVWTDDRNGLSDIYGARVSQDGVVLDPEGIAICTEVWDQCAPSIAFDGTNYFVVWIDDRDRNHDIYGARINQAGVVLDPEGIAIFTAEYSQRHPSIAFDGTNYLVVWNSGGHIYGTRVSQTGVVLDPDGFAISPSEYSQRNLAVAFDGTNYLVVWESHSSEAWGIYGARVSQDGTVLDPDGFAISESLAPNSFPSVAFDGINYLVVWDDSRHGDYYEIYGARVSQDGVVLDPDGFAIPTEEYEAMDATVAFDGTNYLVVYYTTRNNLLSSGDIYGTRVSQEGIVLDPNGFVISTTAYAQWVPSVAFDGTNYLVVWTDYRNGLFSDIYGARVSQEGVILDPDGFVISDAYASQVFPSITFDGTNYLVVWHDYRNWSWVDFTDIYGARVSQDGVVLDPDGIAISTGEGGQVYPAVAFDGTNYLVVFDNDSDIYGARLNQAGVVLDPDGFAISSAPYHQERPSIAFDGTNYLVVWQDDRNAPTYRYCDIYGVRVSPAGVVLGSDIAICFWRLNQYDPAVAFDGTNYLVVWTDYRNELFSDIYGAQVSPAGNVVDTFAVVTQSWSQISPAIAYGSGNQLLITYSGWVDYINNHPANTMRIWGKFYPFVGVEENNQPLTATCSLLDIYPNPFVQITAIRWQMIDKSGERSEYGVERCALKIYDISGRLVRQYDDATMRLSDHIVWYGDNDFGQKLPAGVYLCRLVADEYSATKKIIKLR